MKITIDLWLYYVEYTKRRCWNVPNFCYCERTIFVVFFYLNSLQKHEKISDFQSIKRLFVLHPLFLIE